MKILIIDDEKIIRDVVSQLVEDEGHEAECASHGAAALGVLESSPCDLVLLDMNLDRESGLDVLGEIHRLHPRVPVVVFTAASTASVAVAVMGKGAYGFLEKPFAPEQLQRLLERVEVGAKAA
jgi:DNA-binding NtrC family response regulator